MSKSVSHAVSTRVTNSNQRADIGRACDTHSVMYYSLYIFSDYWFDMALHLSIGGCRHDRMVVGFTTTCAISVYQH